VETALYYLFSTVAQTLAGAIALLGALVLFRMQQLSAAMEQSVRTLIDRYHHAPDGSHSYAQELMSGDFTSVRDHFVTGPGKRVAGQADVIYFANVRELDSSLESRKTILIQFRYSLILTAIVILFSIGSIPVAPALAKHYAAAIVVIVVTVLAVAASLLSYGRLAQAILSRA